jgi:hypothetical protein
MPRILTHKKNLGEIDSLLWGGEALKVVSHVKTTISLKREMGFD